MNADSIAPARGPAAGRLLHLALIAAIMTHFGCSKQDAGGGGFSMPPMPVEVAQATSQEVVDQFEAVGTIEAIESVILVSEIDAMVVALPFKEGSEVSRGALIARLDDAQLSADLQRAEALRAQQQATYERVKAVVEQKAGALQDLDDAAAALKVADANLALSKARYAKTRIVAPFDGSIGARRVSVGTFLRAGQPIAEIANLDNIRVRFSAPEGFLALLRKGAGVTVTVPVYPDHKVTRSGEVAAVVPNPGRKFIPGMSANVAAVLGTRPNAITVPNEAVFANGNQSFVFVVKPDSTVVRTAITLGSQLTDAVEVLQGLEAGAQIVRAGHQKLFDGARVVPVASQGAAQR
jgi:membrane fusion protein (multidrug efflux system)